MAQLKRLLAGAMALCLAGSVLTACGDDTSASEGGDSKEEATTTTAKADEGGEKETEAATTPAAEDIPDTTSTAGSMSSRTDLKSTMRALRTPLSGTALP